MVKLKKIEVLSTYSDIDDSHVLPGRRNSIPLYLLFVLNFSRPQIDIMHVSRGL